MSHSFVRTSCWPTNVRVAAPEVGCSVPAVGAFRPFIFGRLLCAHLGHPTASLKLLSALRSAVRLRRSVCDPLQTCEETGTLATSALLGSLPVAQQQPRSVPLATAHDLRSRARAAGKAARYLL